MTGEIVNLRKIRKAKARAAEEAKAEQNRRRFGRSKAERETEDMGRERDARLLDGHRLVKGREPGTGDDPA
jgi:hypothetical protein